jgi:hypothetical protein
MNMWQWLAFAGVLTGAVAIALGVWGMLLLRRLQRRVLHQETALTTLETQLVNLRGALSAVCSGELVADQRQTDMERKLRQLSEQHEQLLMRDPDEGPYRHAMRLADHGAGREELMEICGLSKGEADLLLSMNPPAGEAARDQP